MLTDTSCKPTGFPWRITQKIELGTKSKLKCNLSLLLGLISMLSLPLQVDHIALNMSLTSARKVKWLRERMIGSSAETLLMNHIKEFILHDEPVDVEKLRKCLHRQVSYNRGWPQFLLECSEVINTNSRCLLSFCASYTFQS